MKLSNIITVVKENVEYLAYSWYENIKSSEYFPGLNNLPDKLLQDNGLFIFDTLAIYLETGDSTEKINIFGHNFYLQDISLDEIIESVFIAKSVAANLIIVENPLTNSEADVDTFKLLNRYFDHLISNLTQGFTNSIYAKLREDEKYTDDELKSIFNFSSIQANSSLLISDILEQGLNRGIVK